MVKANRKHGDTKRAIGYLRVSSDDQALGPDAQRAALERWARAQGVELVAVHADLGVSGGAELDKRPGLLAALADLSTNGAGLLLVAKRDRLARDVVVAGMVERLVERAGARVTSADGAGNGDGPEAALLRGIMDVFAQYERALIRARTRAALAVKRGRGERLGGDLPYGYHAAQDGVHLESDDDEQRVIAAARDLRAEGLSLRAIGAALEARGLLPRSGRRWHPETVRALLPAQEVAA
ncbi:MAG: recombinase family protein [Deltaproteobacteria bacterium]|nr:recombinase family protein [Deltaproteobacteria bacterium]